MIHLTTHKAVKMKNREMGNNKMDGFTSINVSVKRNEFCQSMQKCEDKICSHCYARRIYQIQENNYSENTDLFLSENFKPEFIDRAIIRLHSFGELYNDLHLENIYKLVTFNHNTQFTLWTKRKDIVCRVTARTGKPDNLILIYSSPMLNKKERLPKFFNKVFTVYDSSNTTTINCQKSCKSCMKCYTKKDKTIYINESLK